MPRTAERRGMSPRSNATQEAQKRPARSDKSKWTCYGGISESQCTFQMGVKVSWRARRLSTARTLDGHTRRRRRKRAPAFVRFRGAAVN